MKPWHHGFVLKSHAAILAWPRREEQYTKKFERARAYVFTELLGWIDSSLQIEGLPSFTIKRLAGRLTR